MYQERFRPFIVVSGPERKGGRKGEREADSDGSPLFALRRTRRAGALVARPTDRGGDGDAGAV